MINNILRHSALICMPLLIVTVAVSLLPMFETTMMHGVFAQTTDGGGTDDTTSTNGGGTDDTTSTNGGGTDDTTSTNGGGTDDTTSTNGGGTDDTTILENFQGVYANLDKSHHDQYKCSTGIYVTVTGFSLSATRDSQTTHNWKGSFSIHGEGGGVKSGDISSGTASNSQFSLSGAIDKDNLCTLGLEAGNGNATGTTDLSQVGASMTISTPQNGCPGDVIHLQSGQTTNKFSHVTVNCKHSG